MITISVETAEAVFKETEPKKRVLLLEAIQDAIQETCRHIDQDYCQIMQALSEQYSRRLYASRQLCQCLDAAVSSASRQIAYLKAQQTEVEWHLDRYQNQLLPDMQRQTLVHQAKRAKRQHQYHKVHWIPLVAHCYKRKYLRARDKHASAEQRVAQLRQAIESCRHDWTRAAHSLHQATHQRDQASQHRKRVQEQLTALEQSLAWLEQARQFWLDFKHHQVHTVLETIRALSKAFPSTAATTIDNDNDNNNNDDEYLIKSFKMACFEYSECFAHGQQHWSPNSLAQVEFDCAFCNETRWEWPSSVRGTSQLACRQCHWPVQPQHNPFSSSSSSSYLHCSPRHVNEKHKKKNVFKRILARWPMVYIFK